MKPLSIEPVFMPSTAEPSVINALRSRLRKMRTPSEQFRLLSEVPFDEAYDLLRALAAEYVERGETEHLISTFRALLEASPVGEADGTTTDNDIPLVNIHAALLQLITAVQLQQEEIEDATASAAATLTYLSLQPRRKDIPFQQILGALLYDVAYMHGVRDEHRQAERAIEKSIKIFERLARSSAQRYASPQMMTLNGATAVYHNRENQTRLLARYQADTSALTQMLEAGAEDAALRLSESLANEGDTLQHMGKHREAIQYYSRALKVLTKVEPTFTLQQLRLSISLGESMLAVSAMRDKGVHLLNTMLHKATKINALEEHRRIVDALYHAKSRSLDILSLWHKLFPK